MREADGERLEGVGRGLDGGCDRGPLRGQEVAAEGVFRGEGDGVDDAVDLAPPPFEVSGHGLDVLRLVDVELQDGGLGVELLGGPFGEAAGAAEGAQDYLRALLGGQPRRRVGDGAPVQDAGNQHLLAFEQSRHLASRGSVLHKVRPSLGK